MIEGPWTVEIDGEQLTFDSIGEPMRYCWYCGADQYQHDEAAYVGHMLREHRADLYPGVDGLPTPWPREALLAALRRRRQ